MKKALIGIILVAIAGFAIYKLAFDKGGNDGPKGAKQQPLAISKNSSAFNESFDRLLTGYFELKDALVEYDTLKANAAARNVAGYADSLQTEQITGDSTGDIQKMAADYAASISGSAKGLVGEGDLTKKKREFQMISESLYELVRTVRYDRKKLFHQHCPMAFNDDEEAYWISDNNKVVNPYLGKKHPKYKDAMLGCGDITDSLDYTR
ncbi:MAG: DUF3347 domain-containing protein [Gemmatimonadaceae bacterium]|nr:DUF3347 domain-containing protein [Chitinophagaceae bacterium]